MTFCAFRAIMLAPIAVKTRESLAIAPPQYWGIVALDGHLVKYMLKTRKPTSEGIHESNRNIF